MERTCFVLFRCSGRKTYPNAAWYYAKPYDAAMNIKDHVAFYTSKVNVTVED
ncbi:hypothetical protein ASPACDRAFT_79622 [Aspergillus aculeatus ATCC 16872]|uniref:DUF427 domain-containing protein n=1 Tax=Aspergillus aculeatus (strain ATCC 16872 / CBS 172.66 / WB 5094) TaxID=690307 RepID=A0A1L9WRR3_ASPA1|nr:uncharacterized protein ASPACDRAFT_79622 [Aspergillus aculeatus ATCC 16872]OJJ98834.1 hypothetical protein ASPACDRAFT_79622 [Aspergillus aculeatus ATCC 16872]